MAISPMMIKERYKDLSVEELERKLEETKKGFCFNSKEEQIRYVISNFLYPSTHTNNSSRKKALEELLLEKTGKDYSYEPKMFEIEFSDAVDCVIKDNSSIEGIENIEHFFKKLSDVSDSDKAFLLSVIVQEEKMLRDFVKESTDLERVDDIYIKYEQIAKEYYARNRRIG